MTAASGKHWTGGDKFLMDTRRWHTLGLNILRPLPQGPSEAAGTIGYREAVDSMPFCSMAWVGICFSKQKLHTIPLVLLTL
ncbi:hypothetical protein CTA1_3331 [Colletotrichum tanaceti]|uniref:Uncharacterized protein n=1 Tax=Colletotrichum tanaceti TaxID=1306861 RepID=A0A4V6DFP2_9PEZI|nr:hypothetical protein CTA1_3331 [Colletotrichum tanaceti]